MRRVAAMALAALLAAACDRSEPDQSLGPAAIEAGLVRRPELVASSEEVERMIAALGPPWNHLTDLPPTPDSFSGGEARALLGEAGSATIFTAVDGAPWRVRLGTGMGGRCGDPRAAAAGAESLARQINPGRTLTPAESRQLTHALATGTGEGIDLGYLHLAATGGCVPNVTLTAAR